MVKENMLTSLYTIYMFHVSYMSFVLYVCVLIELDFMSKPEETEDTYSCTEILNNDL